MLQLGAHWQERIQKVWLGANGGGWGRGAVGAEVERRSAEVESSAVGARIEAFSNVQLQ